jgi:hypothetical protein
MVTPRGKFVIPIKKVSKSPIYRRPTNPNLTGGFRVVKAVSGDTMAKFAERYGANPVDVANLNGMTSINAALVAGREMKIPIDNKALSKQSIQPDKNFGPKPTQTRDGKIQAVMSYFNENLNDPYSMRFVRWSDVISKNYLGKSYWSVQVKFRAKNLLGAYVLSEMIFYLKNNKVVATEKLY